MTDLPDGGKLDEILASGRCPGFVVRGSESKSLNVDVHAHYSGPKDPKARKALMAREWREARAEAEAKKVAARPSRKKDGAIRHIGSLPVEVFDAMKKTYGDDFKGRKQKQILKEHGYLWDS